MLAILTRLPFFCRYYSLSVVRVLRNHFTNRQRTRWDIWYIYTMKYLLLTFPSLDAGFGKKRKEQR